MLPICLTRWCLRTDASKARSLEIENVAYKEEPAVVVGGFHPAAHAVL